MEKVNGYRTVGASEYFTVMNVAAPNPASLPWFIMGQNLMVVVRVCFSI